MDSSSDPVAVKFLDLLDTFNPEQHIKRRLITVVTPLTSYSLDLTTMILFHMYPWLIQQSPMTMLCSVRYPWQKPCYPRREINYRKLKSIDMERFVEDISNSSLTDENVTDLTSLYYGTLLSILDQHASLNPLNPNTKIYILICCLYTLPIEVVGRSF